MSKLKIVANNGQEGVANDVKKSSRKPKEDISKYTLIQHIERIVALTNDSEFEEKKIAKVMPYAELMAERLGLTPTQCIFIAIFVDNCNDNNIRYSDIASHFDCSKIRIMCYNNDLDILVEKSYIKKNRDYGFRIEKEVVTSLMEDKPYTPPVISGLDVFALFEHLGKYFEERTDNKISTSELNSKIQSLMEENSVLHFVKSINKLVEYREHCVNNAYLILVYMCHLLVNDDDDNVRIDDIEKIIDNRRDMSYIKKMLKNSTHQLLEDGLIEVKKEEGLFSRDYYCLSKKVKQEVLSDFDIEVETTQAVDAKNIIKCDTISAKSLFYNDLEGKQIEQLSSLLEQDNFANMQQRLADSGMRRGFAVLFYGSPGTGKTESVYQIARATGRDIVEVNVSQIKSMWVGESEKNIKATFDNYRRLAKSSDRVPILLFNEADAVLGVRQEGAAKAVDKMENAIQNIILQEMESLDGIMIATTNLTQNLDKAFERRFLYKIEFQKPCIDAKRSIWLSMLPSLSVEDALHFAKSYDFSGGQIENIARKQTVEFIINGVAPTFDQLNSYCHSESIEKHNDRRRIGF